MKTKPATHKQGEDAMNTILQKDLTTLMVDTERIKDDLERLERDYSVWARKQEEKDLADLLEDLKGAEVDVSLLLTDCVSAGCHCGENAPKVVFHDLHDLFSCLDKLFNDLKMAREQLEEAHIHAMSLEHLDIDYGRFAKLITEIRGYLNA